MDLILCIVLMFAALLFTVWSGGQLFFATSFGLALFCIYALRHGWSSVCSPPAGCSAAPSPIWCAWA